MARLLSCGVLVLDGAGALLLCHATGTPRWDIPKGLAEPGESPLDAACREADEETGIVLEPADLLDLGRHAYLRNKDLHLQAARPEGLDAARCRCRSFVRDAWGRMRPEVDAWAWAPFRELASPRIAKGLAALFAGAVPLGPLEATLAGRAPARWAWHDGASPVTRRAPQ
jgi:8-oxo-dGTP pyrophosphatase MutT (NUDIX family)